ncbi:MAG: phosphoribosylamine--glycine ligase N-terminal domain-containing protein, partial [Sphaerochaetaceae bacterium]
MKRSVLIIGSGAREHAIAYALSKSTHSLSINCCGPTLNPGIKAICDRYEGTVALGAITDAEWVRDIALRLHADLVVIGPEAPLEARVA